MCVGKGGGGVREGRGRRERWGWGGTSISDTPGSFFAHTEKHRTAHPSTERHTQRGERQSEERRVTMSVQASRSCSGMRSGLPESRARLPTATATARRISRSGRPASMRSSGYTLARVFAPWVCSHVRRVSSSRRCHTLAKIVYPHLPSRLQNQTHPSLSLSPSLAPPPLSPPCSLSGGIGVSHSLSHLSSTVSAIPVPAMRC